MGIIAKFLGRCSALFLFTTLVGGCASGGAPADDEPRVPVYRVGEETPCEHTSMGRVLAAATLTSFTEGEYERAWARELGRAGAKVGADAVIAEEPVLRLPFNVARVRTGERPSPPRPREVEFEGEAVRWIEGTCKG